MSELKTVGDYIKKLSEFPEAWRVSVSTAAGGGIAVEHREVGGESVVAVFGSNGGRFGENPLTEEEYQSASKDFIEKLSRPDWVYTSIHGDHRMYKAVGTLSDSCYGKHYDNRIVERMVSEGLISARQVDLDRVKS